MKHIQAGVCPDAGDWPADGGLSGLNLILMHPPLPHHILPVSPSALLSTRCASVPTQGKTLALHKEVFTDTVKLLNFNPTKKSMFWQWIIDDIGESHLYDLHSTKPTMVGFNKLHYQLSEAAGLN